jgi:hypothetical protein
MLVVDLGGNGIGIRTETDPAPFFQAPGRAILSYAVGPNGKLAYWKTGDEDALPHELHIYDTTTRTDRTVLTLTDEHGGAGGFMVWSTDGTGIAFGSSDPSSAFEGRLAPRRPTLATWWLLDVASGTRRKIATMSDAWFVPVSWDRATDTATATDYGRDGPSTPTRLFHVWDPQHAQGKATTKVLPGYIDPRTVHADTAARYALGLEPYTCGQSTCRNLWIWNITDPTAAVPRKIPGRILLDALFRPGTIDIYASLLPLVGEAGAPALVELGPPSSSMLREVFTPLRSSFVFRADGSAIVLGSYNFTDGRGALLDPDNGATTSFQVGDVQDVRAGIGGVPPRAAPPPSASGAPAASPSPTPNLPGFATAEEAADAVKQALEGNQPQLVARLVRPAGWYAQWLIDNAKTDPMTAGAATGWLTLYPQAKRTVEARPLYDTDPQHPFGEKYVRSLWLDFGGYPEEKADIMLGRDGGRWYWTSVLLFRPPPIGLGGTTIDGYATLLAVGDATVTVKFRTFGARCCTDQSLDGRTMMFRSDGNTYWARADGRRAGSAAATGATVGSDVWIQFVPSSLAADGSYRLSAFAKMYP